MKYRDPISSAGFFASSLYTSPKETLSSTFRGAWEGSGQLDSLRRYATPVIAAAGLGLVFTGAATLDPMAVTLGLVAAGDAAGTYLEVGNNLHPKSPAPAPKPPTADLIG